MKELVEDEQFGTLADFQCGTSVMVPSNFEGLVGYRTLRDEGQVPLKAYGCVFGSFPGFCLYCTYCMSVPSLHTESTDSVIFLCTGDDARLLGLLLKHFGKQSFKEWQLKVIQGVLEGQNALVVQPTGSGKSLNSQL